MLLDGRTIPPGERLDADICIIGAGPAGLALALSLEAAANRIVLLAGGDGVVDGEVAGQPYPPLASTRAGGVGGTAWLWDAELKPSSFGARYAPLAPIDFDERDDGMPGGWPFARDTLDKFYEQAHELCDAGPYEYEPPEDATSITGAGVVAGIFRFGASEAFTEIHRGQAERSRKVHLLEHAIATRLVSGDDGGRLASVEVATVPGRQFVVVARTYVLAAGGIENARLLLSSGIGGESPVGRCFMDHPTIRCRLEAARGDFSLGFLDTWTAAGRLLLGRIELSAETMRRERLLNGGFFFVPARDRELRAGAAAREFVRSARERRVPARALHLASDIASGVDALAYHAHRRLVAQRPQLAPSLKVWRRSRLLDTLGVGPISGWSRRRRQPSGYDVYHVIEQAPDPERRVTLSSRRDAFGYPLARLHWFIGERELESADSAEEILRQRLEQAGIGTLRTGRDLAAEGELVASVHPTAHHHLGTTRMHPDPRFGVVDPDGRVHDASNLFVTGGSVFPRSGFVNPTLTVVALALRLGAYLRKDRSS